MEKGEYLIVGAGKKNVLVKFLSDEGTHLNGRLDSPKNDDQNVKETVDFKLKDVLARLGKHPKIGTAFGVKVEPLVSRIPDNHWGEIRMYKRMDDAVKAEFMSGLKEFKQELKAKNLHQVKPILEVRAIQGKQAGCYRHRPKEEQDLMTVRVGIDFAELQYILAHETAHGIWFRMMTKRSRLKWIKIYHEYISMLEVDDRDLARLLDEVHTAKSIGSATRAVEEEDQPIMRECIRHVTRVHGLTKHHLDAMLDAEEELTDYWPSAIELSEKEIVVTEYARKSPEELFSESFAHWFVKRKLPKKIEAALEKTLRVLDKKASQS